MAHSMTEEEAQASLSAALGDFESGRYWSLYDIDVDYVDKLFDTHDMGQEQLDSLYELLKEGFFKLDRQVMGDGGRTMLLSIVLPVGVAGSNGKKLAAVGRWQKSNAKVFEPAQAAPQLVGGNPVRDVAEGVVKGFNQWVSAPLALITGVAVVGLIIYAATKLKGSRS